MSKTKDDIYEVVINGKKVWFKRRLPMKEGASLPALIKACESGSFEDQIAVCSVLIERWEFEGNPADPASYEPLDVFDEIAPLCQAAGRYISERFGAVSPKN